MIRSDSGRRNASRGRRYAPLRDLNIIHQAQAEHGLAFQGGTRAARGQHDHFPGPQGRDHPLDDVARGVAFAFDVALFIDFVTAGADDLRVERQVAAGQADAIELQLQISLAEEVAGIFGRFEVADQIASTRKSLLAELSHAAQVAKHGIADIGCGRGEIGFIQGALQKSAGGQDNFPCAGA